MGLHSGRWFAGLQPSLLAPCIRVWQRATDQNCRKSAADLLPGKPAAFSKAAAVTVGPLHASLAGRAAMLCFWMIFSHNHHLRIIAHASLHYCAFEFESGRQSGHAVLSRSTARRSVRGSPVVAVRHSCHSWMRDEAAPADPTRPLFHCRGAGQ